MVETGEHGLKRDAIGFSDGLTIALASTAPAYSLAAVIGSIVVIVGFQAPAALLVSFVPMFFIAAAFYYMNRADQDCGTSFSWVTRAIGPWVTLLALALIAVMTTICVLGTELSAHLQKGLMVLQIGPLLLFAGVALYKVLAGEGPAAAVDPSLSWFNPFEIGSGGALTGALLLGVFIYWGWESAVNLNEETEGSATAPGLAGLLSTVLLLVTYLGVATALVAAAARGCRSEDSGGNGSRAHPSRRGRRRMNNPRFRCSFSLLCGDKEQRKRGFSGWPEGAERYLLKRLRLGVYVKE